MWPVLRSKKVDLLNPLFIFLSLCYPSWEAWKLVNSILSISSFLYVTRLEKYESWSTQSSLYLPFSLLHFLWSMKVDQLNPLYIFLSLCEPSWEAWKLVNSLLSIYSFLYVTVLRSKKVDLTNSSLYLPFSMLPILRDVQSFIEKERLQTLICWLLKLDTPMDLTSPFFTSSSMASQVVVGWVSSNLHRDSGITILSFSATYIVIDSLVIVSYFNFLILLYIEPLYFARGVLYFRCIWTYIFQ